MQLRDQFGNNCDNALTASLDVKIMAKDDKGTSHVVTASIKDNKNGTITVGYVPIVSGAYIIQASILVKGTRIYIHFLVGSRPINRECCWQWSTDWESFYCVRVPRLLRS